MHTLLLIENPSLYRLKGVRYKYLSLLTSISFTRLKTVVYYLCCIVLSCQWLTCVVRCDFVMSKLKAQEGAGI